MEKSSEHSDQVQKFTRLPGRNYKRIILIVSLLLLVLAIPLVVFFIQQNQDTRQRASTTAGYAGTTRKLVISDVASNIPEFNQLCQDANVSPCQLTIASHYKGFDTDDPNNDLYNTEFLTTGNQYVVLGKAGTAQPGQGYAGTTRKKVGGGTLSSVPEFQALCTAAGRGSNCVLDVASHYKGFDTENTSNDLYNTEFLSAGNQFVVLGKAGTAQPGQGYAGTTRKNVLSGTLYSVPEFKALCDAAGRGSVTTCRLDVASHYKGFDTDDTNNPLYNTEFLVAGNQFVVLGKAGSDTANGYGGGTRKLILSGTLTGTPEFNQLCQDAGIEAAKCGLKIASQYKGFDTDNPNDDLYNTELLMSGNKFVVLGKAGTAGGATTSPTTAASGTPPAGSGTPTTGANQINVTYNHKNNPAVNEQFTIKVVAASSVKNTTVNQKLLIDQMPQSVTYAANDPIANFDTYTWTGSLPLAKTYDIQFAANCDSTARNCGTSPNLRLAAPATITIGSSSVSTTPIPAGSIQLQFNDNIKLQGNSNNVQAIGTRPVSTTKRLTVELFNVNDDTTLVASGSGNIFYNPTTTNFGTGTDSIVVSPIAPATSIPAGTYKVKVKTPRYLKKWAPGTITVPATATTAPISVSTVTRPIILLTGDITDKNVINIQGYNALIDCGAAVNIPPPQTNPVSGVLNKYAACKQHLTSDPTFDVTMLDLNDDGFIDSIDYVLLTRNLIVKKGD